MGYSIMTPFATEQDKEQMQKFMEKQYRSFSEVFKDAKLPGAKKLSEYPAPHDDLTYMPSSKKESFILGFDYGPGGPDEERDYFFNLCFWMSVQAGKRKKFGKHLDMPYINYDGTEEWVLFVNQPRDTKIESMHVTEDGYTELVALKQLKIGTTIEIPAVLQPVVKKLEKIDAAIHNELKRLSTEWKKQLKS